MREMGHHLTAVVSDALLAAFVAIQQPGALDKIGAFSIGLFVLACFLLTPAS